MRFKKILAALSALCLFGSVANAAFTLKTTRVITEGSLPVNFEGDASPVVVNDTAMAAARVLADNLGMSVEWDQAAQTALLSITIEESEIPVKRFVKEQIEKTGGYGLELAPKCITAAMTVGRSEAEIRYIFTDAEGDEVCLGKTYELCAAPIMVEGETLMLPVRDTAMMFGFQVSWSGEDMSVEITLPDSVVAPKGLKIMPSYVYGQQSEPQPQVYAEEVSASDPVAQNTGTYLGRFKITHYCPCSICNGGYNGTAWAGSIVPGQTIAVDPKVITPLSWVYIDGYGLRRAEDCGGAIKGNHIDMAVSSHSEAYRLGVVYKDVWLQ
ncbi:MAG: stalk domain-containing protein [Clostridiales bacterium]|nr:stalk domain-containing protein [Clostridiales bacterium]